MELLFWPLRWLEPLLGWMGDPARVCFWGGLSGVISMLLYRKLAPQSRIKEIQEKQAGLQAAMADYDGDFAGMQRMLLQNLSLAFRRLGIAFLPSLLAGVPVIWIAGWVNYQFSDVPPVPVAISMSAAGPADPEPQGNESTTKAGWSTAADRSISTTHRVSPELLSFGPAWLRGWIAIFVCSCTVSALIVRARLKIA